MYYRRIAKRVNEIEAAERMGKRIYGKRYVLDEADYDFLNSLVQARNKRFERRAPLWAVKIHQYAADNLEKRTVHLVERVLDAPEVAAWIPSKTIPLILRVAEEIKSELDPWQQWLIDKKSSVGGKSNNE
jgi:hypothetical protein